MAGVCVCVRVGVMRVAKRARSGPYLGPRGPKVVVWRPEVVVWRPEVVVWRPEGVVWRPKGAVWRSEGPIGTVFRAKRPQSGGLAVRSGGLTTERGPLRRLKGLQTDSEWSQRTLLVVEGT